MTILMKPCKRVRVKVVGPQVMMRVLTLYPIKVRASAKVARVRQSRKKNSRYFSHDQEVHKWSSIEGHRCYIKLWKRNQEK